MTIRLNLIAGLGLAAMLAACAQQEEPAPIYAEPVFDKFGNPSCRPPDVAVGGVYTADLPLCAQIGGGAVMAGEMMDGNGGTTGTTPGDVPGDGDGSNQNQNRNQNQNENRNTNQTQSGS